MNMKTIEDVFIHLLSDTYSAEGDDANLLI